MTSLDREVGAEPVPLVSVGVIAHNHGDYIAECLESVAGSNYPHLQLVVISDGSDDDTDAQARDWLSSHPAIDATYVCHPQAHGIGRCLNEAITLAKGEFLAG